MLLFILFHRGSILSVSCKFHAHSCPRALSLVLSAWNALPSTSTPLDLVISHSSFFKVPYLIPRLHHDPQGTPLKLPCAPSLHLSHLQFFAYLCESFINVCLPCETEVCMRTGPVTLVKCLVWVPLLLQSVCHCNCWSLTVCQERQRNITV